MKDLNILYTIRFNKGPYASQTHPLVFYLEDVEIDNLVGCLMTNGYLTVSTNSGEFEVLERRILKHGCIAPESDNLLDKLIAECKNRNLNVSFSNQRMNDFSVEIYKGYKEEYECVYYTDGHLYYEVAIQNALIFLNTL